MKRPAAEPGGPALSAEELAYLVGGAARVAEVALAGLLAYGQVRVSSEGVLSPVHATRPALSHVQALVLSETGVGARPAMTVLGQVARSKLAHVPLAALRKRRLALAPAGGRRRPLAAPPPRTPAGDAAVAWASHLARGGARTGAEVEALLDPVLLGWAAGLVAVGGLGAYPDPAIAAALASAAARAEADRQAAGGGGGCGSHGYGCGSSCGGGGGGGCGGGCGGG